MKSLLVAVMLAATSAAFGAEASKKHWQSVLKAAEEARENMDHKKARSLLEGVAAEAAALGKENAAETSYALGVVMLASGEAEQAISIANEALEKLGPDPKPSKQREWRGTLLTLKLLGLSAARKDDEGLKTAEETRAAMERIGIQSNSQLYFLNMYIGEQYARKKAYAEAEKAYLAALKLTKSKSVSVRQEWSGSETVFYEVQKTSAGEVPIAMALGDLMLDQDKMKEAEEYYQTSLNLTEKYFGNKHRALVFPLEKMARVHLKSDRRKEFENDVQRSYQIALKETGSEPWLANPLWLKLEVDIRDGDPAAVKQTARKISEVFVKKSFDSKWAAEGIVRAAFAVKTNDWEKVADAQRAFREAASEIQPAQPAKVGGMLMGFGEVAEEAGKLDLARVNYEELVKLGEKTGDKMLQVGALGKAADVSIAEKKHEEALATLQKITALLKEKYGDDSRVVGALAREAAVLRAMGRNKEAGEMDAKAQEVVKKSFLRR